MLSDEITELNITGRGTTSGAAEQTLPLTLGTAAPAATLAVPQGETWMISDWIICAPPAGTIHRIQQSNDGGLSWFNKAVARVIGSGPSKVFRFRTPIKVKGGPAVLVRARVTTPPGPGPVDVAWGAMSQP
jgi:hypothetical protein